MSNPFPRCGCGATWPCGKHMEQMGRSEVLHLWDSYVGEPTQAWPLLDSDKVEFARAVQRAERERCAKVVEQMERVFHQSQVITDRCAAAIRELE
jgi:hypothetical protein